MIRKLLAATALALVTVAPANAAQFSVNLGSGTTPTPVAGNIFSGALATLGMASFSNAVNSISIDGPSFVEFYYLGSESGYYNTFCAGAVCKTENSPALPGGPDVEDFFGDSLATLTNNLLTPAIAQSIGSVYYASAGNITNWAFTTNMAGIGAGGANATIGQDGFGLFTAAAAGTTSFNSSYLILAYDDQTPSTCPGTCDDDNHDDFLVLARISALPVPEPSTWAMLLVGFMTVGVALRRRGTDLRVRQAV